MTNKKTNRKYPTFKDWQNKYYAKHPEEIPYLEKELLADLRRYPNMPLEVFLNIVRRIGELYRMTALAKKANLSRTHLYKALSADGNPRLDTLQKLASVTGVELRFVAPRSQQPHL